jgi:hypothetical protein
MGPIFMDYRSNGRLCLRTDGWAVVVSSTGFPRCCQTRLFWISGAASAGDGSLGVGCGRIRRRRAGGFAGGVREGSPATEEGDRGMVGRDTADRRRWRLEEGGETVLALPAAGG